MPVTNYQLFTWLIQRFLSTSILRNALITCTDRWATAMVQTKPVFPFWLSVQSWCQLVKELGNLVCASSLHSVHKINAQYAGPQFADSGRLDLVSVNKNKLLEHRPIVSQAGNVKRVDVRMDLFHYLLNLSNNHNDYMFIKFKIQYCH